MEESTNDSYPKSKKKINAGDVFYALFIIYVIVSVLGTICFGVSKLYYETHAIYATVTGDCYHYHRSGCGSGSYYECTWDEVEVRGLTPCKNCMPKYYLNRD